MIPPLILIILLIFLNPTLAAKFEEDQNVLILHHHNFEKALKQHSHILVMFHAPWCLQCKLAMPEFQKAATSIRAIGSKIALATVDCKLEKELMTQNEITAYPTYKYFVNGKLYNYKGGRNEQQIINWVLKTTSRSIIPIVNFEQLEHFATNNDLTVIYWGDQSSPDFKIYEALSRDFADYPYLSSHSQELKQRFGSPEARVTLIRKLEEPTIHFLTTMEFSHKKLKSFLKNNRFPAVVEFNDKYAKRVFQEKTPTLLLLTNQDNKMANEVLHILSRIGEAKRKTLLTGIVYLETEWGERIYEAFGGPMIKIPALLIIKALDKVEKYLLKEEITEKTVLSFVDNFDKGKLDIYYKSEPDFVIQNESAVKALVGNNYNQITKDPTKDVFALLCTPWCKHCQATEPLFTKLAQLLLPVKNLWFVKMNAFLNEASGLHVKSTPTILFYPQNNKTHPIKFDGERTLKGFWAWLQPHVAGNIPSDLSNKITQFITNYKEPTNSQQIPPQHDVGALNSQSIQGVQLPMSHSDIKSHGADHPIGVVPIQGVSVNGAIASKGVEIRSDGKSDWVIDELRVQNDEL